MDVLIDLGPVCGQQWRWLRQLLGYESWGPIAPGEW